MVSVWLLQPIAKIMVQADKLAPEQIQIRPGNVSVTVNANEAGGRGRIESAFCRIGNL